MVHTVPTNKSDQKKQTEKRLRSLPNYYEITPLLYLTIVINIHIIMHHITMMVNLKR